MISLQTETEIFWSVVIFVALSRFCSRRMTLGSFARFQADDYAMLVTLCFYTSLAVTINIVNKSESNLLPPGFDVSTLSPKDIADREFGSKMVLVVEQSQCAAVWGAKICLLFLYHRLTDMRWQQLGIKILAGYVVISFIVMEILYFGVWCRPFYEYWAVPTDSIQCDAAIHHLITNASFNISSDLILMAIGLPMFLRMKCSWQKKLPLVLIFSLGLFTILAAVLNKVYSFTQPFGSMWSYWYVRESSTALLVANLPFVWHFWKWIAGFQQTSTTTTTTSSSHLDPSPTSSRHDEESNDVFDFAGFLADQPTTEEKASRNVFVEAFKKAFISRDRGGQHRERKGTGCSDDSANFPRALTSEKPMLQTFRRDEGCRMVVDDFITSPTLPPSMASSRSAASFV